MLPALSTLACATVLSLLAAAPASAADWPEQLVKKIEQIDQRSPGSVGVYVKRLDDGKEMSYAGDRPWYMASTAKVPIAIAVLQQVERGKLSLDQEFALEDTDKVDGSGELVWQNRGKRYDVEALLNAMLMRSDNTAANMLIRAIGEDTLNAGARDYMGRREVGDITSYTQIRYDVYSELHPSARELSNRNLVEIAGAAMGPARVQAFSRSADLKADELQVNTMRDAYARYYQRGLNTATMEGYGAMLEKLVQGKLLRIVEEDGDFYPVGSDRPVRGDVRFIFAATEGLDTLVEQDRFLADLRDRISAFAVRIPPLRERVSDIAGLVRHVIALRAPRCGYADRPPTFDDALLRALENDAWPGNVRELVAAVERLLIDATGARVVSLSHCTGHLVRLRTASGTRRGSLTSPLVLQAVADAGGNKTVAAARLGVSRKTIHEYVRAAGAVLPV